MAQNPSLQNTMWTALQNFNHDANTAWTFGENWTNVATQFETFVNKYLFPKLNETNAINVDLGNRFAWLAKEKNYIGQYTEDYVILDSVPVNMNLSKHETLMLERNYPKMATRLYGAGVVKKQKFTLNNNDARFNFATLGDATRHAVMVYKKKISDINVQEESEVKAMLVDWSLNNTQDVRSVVSLDELIDETFEALLNLQNNSAKYNETHLASGGAIGRYTTMTELQNVAILTSDTVKRHLLNTRLANTFQTSGIDFSKRIISFDDLGGTFRMTDDVQITEQNTVNYMEAFGDYQVAVGDIIPEGSVLTYDVSALTEFVGNVEEVKPETDLYAYIFDVNKIKYEKNTNGMLKQPFYNGEFDEVTHWIHYYSRKAVNPFFNNVRIGG